MQSYIQFWGKTARAGAAVAGQPDWHPLAYHALDVAAVAEALLAADPSLTQRLSTAVGLPPGLARGWVVRLAALHDLGKFALSFQGLNCEWWDKWSGGSANPPRYLHRHDALARVLLDDDNDRFQAALGPDIPLSPWAPWLLASTSHHGRPVDVPASALSDDFPPEVLAAAVAFTRDVFQVLGPYEAEAHPTAHPREVRAALKRTSWLVAGMTIAADWLGSNTAWFPFHAPTLELAQYWRNIAQPAAQRAIAAADLSPILPRHPPRFDRLFPGFTPTTLQAHADTLPLPEGPSLHVIEEATGGGKTEAALTLTARLIAAGRATGVYIGLPTMATANALYTRIADFTQRWFAGADDTPELMLAHGQRKLAQAMIEQKRRANAEAYGPGESTATRTASAWLQESTRRTLLAQLGVGTVDQALLGALTVRHQALRLYGLARSVLVVDEVHACDAYMLVTLKTLLEAHAAQGGSAILLSATLPLVMRRELVDAFAKGAALQNTPRAESAAYPLVTSVSVAGLTETPVACRESCVRRVGFQRLSSTSDAGNLLVEAAESGQCAIWIRNTVGDTIHAAAALSARLGPSRVMLFHARFCLGDRLAMEARILEHFGKCSTAAQRASWVVVATQVAEQSLDVDFDVMVSDAAPIDRLVQRAGRLQRHDRGVRPAPVLHVVAPPATDDAGPEWHRATLGDGRFVYNDVGQIWRTLRWLQIHGGFSLPGDARALIEAVFGDKAALPLPPALTHASDQALAEVMAVRSQALARTILVQDGYQTDGRPWPTDAEDEPTTRLGEATTTLRLARREGDLAVPFFDADIDPPNAWTAWPLSDVAVRRRQVATEADDWAALRARCRGEMADLGERRVLVLLTAIGPGEWAGYAHKADGGQVLVRYSSARGLTVERPT